MYRLLTGLALASLAAPAAAALPDPVRLMLEAAIADGRDGEINAVAKYAKRIDPDSAPEVDKLVAAHRARKTAEKEARFEEAGALDLWDGQADLGGSRTTGNTDTLGVTAGFDIQREGRDWRHKLKARGDYQESNGEAVREAVMVAYEPSYKVDDRLSVYGLAQIERDTFQGFLQRISLSGGVGYRAVAEPDLTIDLNAGPAFRATRFVENGNEEAIAGRGSLGLKWTLTPTLKFSNDTAAFLDPENSTLASTSSIDAKIIGSLSARLSYNVRYESNPRAGRDSLDTLSRAALVYDF